MERSPRGAQPGKKKFVLPDTLCIILFIILLTALLTYIIPAGSFERQVNESTGQTLVVAGSYTRAPQQAPVSFFSLPKLLYGGITGNASLIAFLLMCGGALGVMTSTKAIDKFALKVAHALRGKDWVAILVMTTFFGVLGTTMNFSLEAVAFIPMMMAFSVSMGYDKLVGVGIVLLGSLGGATAGVLAPYSTVIAQTIAELPPYSGAWLRVLLFIALITTASLYLYRYGKRVKADQAASLLYGTEEAQVEAAAAGQDLSMNWREIGVVVDLLACLALLVWGALAKGWSYGEISGLFFVMALVAGLLMRYPLNSLSAAYIGGCRSIVAGCLVVGFVKTIQLVMNQGQITDTIINAFAGGISVLPGFLRGVAMYISQMFINLFIVSSSGQAVAVMPVMVPVADLVGVSRQTAVLAFQLGDGFSNYLYPTCASLFVLLAEAKVSFGKWVKFYWPIFLRWTLIGFAAVLLAGLVGYA